MGLHGKRLIQLTPRYLIFNILLTLSHATSSDLIPHFGSFLFPNKMKSVFVLFIFNRLYSIHSFTMSIVISTSSMHFSSAHNSPDLQQFIRAWLSAYLYNRKLEGQQNTVLLVMNLHSLH